MDKQEVLSIDLDNRSVAQENQEKRLKMFQELVSTRQEDNKDGKNL